MGLPVLKEHEAARYNPIYCDQNGCVGNHGNKAANPPCGLAETDVSLDLIFTVTIHADFPAHERSVLPGIQSRLRLTACFAAKDLWPHNTAAA